jgi:CRISPR-associated endonuclease Cas2
VKAACLNLSGGSAVHHLIAYDIADPRRLQRIARRLERSAVRCQKSVFLFPAGPAEVETLLDELATLLRTDEDVIQAWRLAQGQPARGLVRGTPLPIVPGGVVLAPRQTVFVERPA